MAPNRLHVIRDGVVVSTDKGKGWVIARGTEASSVIICTRLVDYQCDHTGILINCEIILRQLFMHLKCTISIFYIF